MKNDEKWGVNGDVNRRLYRVPRAPIVGLYKCPCTVELSRIDMAVCHLYREIYRDVPRCLFFTRDSDDHSKNPCVFTWFVKVMVLTMVFELFFLGFPMYFHGESFWESPYSSQKPPVASQRRLKPLGPKVKGPEAQSLTW